MSEKEPMVDSNKEPMMDSNNVNDSGKAMGEAELTHLQIDMHLLISANLHGNNSTGRLFMQMLTEKPEHHQAPYSAELVNPIVDEVAYLLSCQLGRMDAAAEFVGKEAEKLGIDAEQLRAVLVEAEPRRIDWDRVKARTVAHPDYTECVCAPDVECGWDDAPWSEYGTCDVCYDLMCFAADDGFMCPAEINPENFHHIKAAVEEYQARCDAEAERRKKEARDNGWLF